VQDIGSLSAAGTSPPSPQLHSMLAEISRRIESMEHNFAAPLHSALKDQEDRFVSLRTTVTSHVVKTNSMILDLNRKLEEISSTVKNPTQAVTRERPKTDFDWRAFGGTDISPRRK
jgi:hypothetical protein